MEKRPKILVADDEPQNRRLMESLLVPAGYEIILAVDGEDTIQKVHETSPDVILLDVMMPKMDGFKVAKLLKGSEKTKIIPIVMVTALNAVEDRVKAIDAGADDFLAKPVDKLELRARVRTLLNVKAYNDHMLNYQKELEYEVKERTAQLQAAFQKIKTVSREVVYRLSRAAEYKDEDTYDHILRTSRYMEALARKVGLKERTIEAMLYSCPMHDVGKIGIPDKVLTKPGKLDSDEWQTMQKHTLIGMEILKGSKSSIIKLAEIIALSHHEKWDGSGYPKGLKGKEIPLTGRIVAVIDVFDALTTKRPYKEPFPAEKAFAIIKESAGSHFDPEIVSHFFEIQDEILSIMEDCKNNRVGLS